MVSSQKMGVSLIYSDTSNAWDGRRKKNGRSYKEAGGPQQTHIFVRRRYTSSVMFALARRRPSPYMRRSLAQTWKARQSQIPLCRIEFFDEIPASIPCSPGRTQRSDRTNSRLRYSPPQPESPPKAK